MNTDQGPTGSYNPESPPVTPEVVEASTSNQQSTQQSPPQIVIQQGGGGFFRFVSWIGWIGLMFAIPVIIGLVATRQDYFDTTGGIQERYHSLEKHQPNKIAVIKVEGIITDGSFVKRQVDRIRKDKKIKAIVVRVDSPGGTVTGSDYIYHHLTKLRKERDLPVVVSMGSMAASGGYYVAMAVGDQEKSIYAEPTTTTGSIGVIIPHYDLSGLLERFNVKNDSIASHPRKQMLSMTKELSPEDRAILQEYVNESFDRFKEIVQSGRPQFRADPAALTQIATGEIFSATKAEQLGLVDEIGFVEDAVSRAIALAGLNEDEVRVITYRRLPTLLDAISSARVATRDFDTLALEFGVPRPYYLTTTLPVLIKNVF